MRRNNREEEEESSSSQGGQVRDRDDFEGRDHDAEDRPPNISEAFFARKRAKLARINYGNRPNNNEEHNPLNEVQVPTQRERDEQQRNFQINFGDEQPRAEEQFDLSLLPIRDGQVEFPERTSEENKLILGALSNRGSFLFVQPGQRLVNAQTSCWANRPSHTKFHLQPVNNVLHKIMPDQDNRRPLQGSTWVTAIYRKNDGQVIPMHIVTRRTVSSFSNLIERQSKIHSKRIPGFGQLCLIIKCTSEQQKNEFITEYANYLRGGNVNERQFPTIRFCFKQQGNSRLTREYNPRDIIDYQRRREIQVIRVDLNKYVEQYEKELNRYNRCLTSLRNHYGENFDLLLDAENPAYQGVYANFSLEDVELFKQYLDYHIRNLGRVRVLMQEELSAQQLTVPRCVELLQNIQQQHDGALNTQASLERLSARYRAHLNTVNSLLGDGQFSNNPQRPSAEVEEELRQQLEQFLNKLELGNVDLARFESSRELFAWMLDNDIRPGEFSNDLYSRFNCASEWARQIERTYSQEFVQNNAIEIF